jgi:hypothetical protein
MNTLNEIKAFDIKTYKPINTTVYTNGAVVLQTDTRTLLGEKALKIIEARERCSKEIEYLVPTFKQINMANGIYDDETKAQLIALIQLCRTKMDAIDSALIDCETIADVELICYNYEDSSKDALENVA